MRFFDREEGTVERTAGARRPDAELLEARVWTKRLPDIRSSNVEALALGLTISNSVFGRLAADHYRRFPAILRHLLSGIGATGNTGWDLLSYLAFEPEFIGKLIELGYDDTIARRDDVAAFFDGC